jgi:hypothetical protein
MHPYESRQPKIDETAPEYQRFFRIRWDCGEAVPALHLAGTLPARPFGSARARCPRHESIVRGVRITHQPSENTAGAC